jgi:hypothetical protein
MNADARRKLDGAVQTLRALRLDGDAEAYLYQTSAAIQLVQKPPPYNPWRDGKPFHEPWCGQLVEEFRAAQGRFRGDEASIVRMGTRLTLGDILQTFVVLLTFADDVKGG